MPISKITSIIIIVVVFGAAAAASLYFFPQVLVPSCTASTVAPSSVTTQISILNGASNSAAGPGYSPDSAMLVIGSITL